MVSKAAGDDFDDMSPDDHRPTIEFSTTSYAVLELEQRVDLKIKRRGPIDVDVRFRCLAFAHLCMHCIRTYLLSNSIILHRDRETTLLLPSLLLLLQRNECLRILLATNRRVLHPIYFHDERETVEQEGELRSFRFTNELSNLNRSMGISLPTINSVVARAPCRG